MYMQTLPGNGMSFLRLNKTWSYPKIHRQLQSELGSSELFTALADILESDTNKKVLAHHLNKFIFLWSYTTFFLID